MQQSVLVLDFGSQYTQLITRRIRELHVFSEVRPCTISPDDVDLSSVKALILSGGPASVTADDAPEFDPAWLSLGIPTLGICYGMQLIAQHMGGTLGSGARREYGAAHLCLQKENPLFYGFDAGQKTTVWMSHGDHVEQAPEGFSILADSDGIPVAAMGNDETQMYGLQFHPEVVHSARGDEMLSNFVLSIAGLAPDWTPDCMIEQSVTSIATTVADDAQVICGVSGGVDSTIAAVLVHKALGDRLHCIFVDNGLLRKHESTEVVDALGPNGLGLQLHHIDAADEFLKALEGIEDPEEKRKTIGRVFIEVFDREAEKIKNVTHLVQGTLYPDVIESVSVRGPSATIKTHHNVGGLPERMKLSLIEPFRELFKDEVRALGRQLQVPEYLIRRHPFPGPGLAVRVPGCITRERLDLLRDADYIFIEELKSSGLYDDIWQAFSVLLPVKSVGVMGDNRTYESAVALRAVTSEDGMTADWFSFPREVLARISNRIINEVRGINRVVLDVSSKPPSTIEWE